MNIFYQVIKLPFKSIENKHDVYRGNNCMKKFCESYESMQ